MKSLNDTKGIQPVLHCLGVDALRFLFSSFFTDRPARSEPCRYSVYSVVQKWVFRLAGATHCPDKQVIFGKNRLRGHTPLGKIYTEN